MIFATFPSLLHSRQFSQLTPGTEIESRGYVRFGLAFRRDVLAVNANGPARNGLGSLFLAWCLNLIKPTQKNCIANDTLLQPCFILSDKALSLPELSDA